VQDKRKHRAYALGMAWNKHKKFLYVSDSANHCINTYGLIQRINNHNYDNEFVESLGREGCSNGNQLNNPGGIYYDEISQCLFICDRLNQRIQIIDTTINTFKPAIQLATIQTKQQKQQISA